MKQGGVCAIHGPFNLGVGCMRCIGERLGQRVADNHDEIVAGVKADDGKVRIDLVPVHPLRQWAEVLSFGARKYADRNWEKGLAWSRVYAALQRHLLAWWAGEDADPETKLPHLAHVMCCVGFLLEYTRTHTERDDRPKDGASWEQPSETASERNLAKTQQAEVTCSDGGSKYTLPLTGANVTTLPRR